MCRQDFDMSAATQTYEERAEKHTNACAKSLLETIARKQSNLCVSVDVTTKEDFLAVVDAVGPFVALIKVRRSYFPAVSARENGTLTYYSHPC